METIVHIGQPKTGTTSIQQFLRDQKETLKRQGVFVPDRLLGFNNPSHFMLNVYSLEDHRRSPMKDQLLKKVGNEEVERLKSALPAEVEVIYAQAKKEACNRIIWTNEGLFLLNSLMEYKDLTGLFCPHSKRVHSVCVLRDKNSFLKSFQQELMHQDIATNNDIDSYTYLKEDSWLIDYDRKKALLSEAFDQAVFLAYDSTDIIKPFLQALNISISNIDLRLNASHPKRNKWWPFGA